MKKISVILVLMSLLLVGCDENKEFSYLSFGVMVQNPSTTNPGMQDGDKVEFVALVGSEPMTINEKESILVYISRADNEIVINVENIDEVFEVGTIVTISGKIDGYLYSTGSEGKIEMLNIIASSITEKEDFLDHTANTTCTNRGGYAEITFTGAEYSTFVKTNDVVVVYYNYKILEDSGQSTAMARISEFDIYHGEELLSMERPMSSDKLSQDAMKNMTYLSAGEEGLAYTAFEKTSNADYVVVEGYDDEFNLTCYYELPIE